MNSYQLEQLAIRIALQKGVNFEPNAKMYFDAPKKGPVFREGPYTLHIPKHPRFAPYLAVIEHLIRDHTLTYMEDQISRRNTNGEYQIEFTPFQFACAFAGRYHPKNIAYTLGQFVSKDDDTSRAVVSRLSELANEFLCVMYITNERFTSTERILVGDDPLMPALAEKIPFKYKPVRSKKGIRARLVRESTFFPTYDAVESRFRQKDARFIILKGFSHRDRFIADSEKILVNGKWLALTRLKDTWRSASDTGFPLFFGHSDLWKQFGREIVLDYNKLGLPQSITPETELMHLLNTG